MMRTTPLLLVLLLIGCARQPQSQEPGDEPMAVTLPTGTPIDLTYPFDEDTIYWPTADSFVREITSDSITAAGYYYAAGNFSAAEHGGTHIDAPVHFAEGRQTVDEIPLENLMGRAIVIDVSAETAENPDYLITADDIQQWERDHRPIADGTVVLFRTGYGKYWPDRQKYLGTDQRGQEAVANLHFPGIDPAAAAWLVQNRSVKAIGIDTASIDYGQSQLFETHRTLFDKNIPAFENVAHMDQLPLTDFVVVALPMKIKGGSGGPLRIVAFVP